MSFLNDLNPVQRKAAMAVEGPVMIVAGAGSGKTRVLTYRIAYLLSIGVPPYQILALTFTNKAANEMKQRIQRLVGEKASELWMGTFHSMFARILRRECDSLGYTRSFTIYDTDDSLETIRRCMADLNISAQQFSPQMIRARISGAKNQLIEPVRYSALARDVIDEHAAAVYSAYQRALERNNAMDFDDLLIKPTVLFRTAPAVLEKYQQRFRFLLIDEFQDTNRAQYEVAGQLAGRGRNICVVGDDSQSIYSFRGADIRNILDFSRDYPDCQVFRLEQNYRSTKSILQAADRLISYNPNRLEKNLWTENPQGERVTLLECSDDRQEGLRIARAIHEESRRRKLDLKDFAVLYRTNSQSRALEDALRRSGIPYVIVGGIRFYERKEVKDVLAYLRLLVNPRDEESLMRVINVPARGIGETTLERLRAYARQHDKTLFEAIEHADAVESIAERAKKSILQFHALISKYRRLRSHMSPSELVRSLVDELGILKMFKEEGTADSLARWENVQELLSAISEFSRDRSQPSLEEFLGEVSLVSDIDLWEGTRNAVTLMTLHASKGLEFPVVFVTGLEEGLLPLYGPTMNGTDLEEERRLLYVGLTRAEQKVYLSHVRLRYRFGDPTYPAPSRFLSEIGMDALEVDRQAENGRAVVPLSSLKRRGRERTAQRPRPMPHHHYDNGAEMPDYEHESQEEIEIRPGLQVFHELFGAGTVLSVNGKGESQKAVVRFDSVGVKNLILKFARLRPA